MFYVYLAPDRSKGERERRKTLLETLKEKRKAETGQIHTIRNGEEPDTRQIITENVNPQNTQHFVNHNLRGFCEVKRIAEYSLIILVDD